MRVRRFAPQSILGPMKAVASKHRLADWFLQWRGPIRKFLKHRGAVKSADLDDVAQEVFLRLMRYDRAELVQHPQAYLLKMAANVAAEWAIRARIVRPHDSKWLVGLTVDGEPETEAAQCELQDAVERALASLPPREREILKLQFFSGLSRAETAAQLGATERSVKRSLVKSYERLRHDLDPALLEVTSRGRE
jgi:RNA polymerase sigma-70 factor (ECF subfamily)